MVVAKTQILAHAIRRSAAPTHRKTRIALGAALALGLIASFGVAPNTLKHPQTIDRIVESLPADVRIEPLRSDDNRFLQVERVQRDDTLGALLARAGISDNELMTFIRRTEAARDLARRLRPGMQISALTHVDGELDTLYFPLDDEKPNLMIERRPDGYHLTESATTPTLEVVLRSAVIQNSLFAAADAADIPDSIAVQLAEIFAGDIDFHRDLRTGDRFSVVYEQKRVRGQPVSAGRVLSAEFVHAEDGKARRAVYFADENGRGGYYDTDGRSLKKAFLRSPLEFSRVTSGFQSSRFHPVLNTWRAHRGVDYGAPIGTKVRSIGDGVVEFAGRQGGYGNIIIVRHGARYSTAYAHLNGFAKGVRKGTRVSQGETLGYVGKTGLASGPHLHYEFRVNNTQVNPLAVTLPEAPPLDAKTLAKFKPAAMDAMSHLKLARSTVSMRLN